MPHLKLWMTSIDNLNRRPCNSQCRQTHSVPPLCNSNQQRTLEAVSSHNSSRVLNSKTNSSNQCRVNSRCHNSLSNRSGRPHLAQVETPNNNLALAKGSRPSVNHRLNSRTICLTACSSHSSTQAAVSQHSTLVCKSISNSPKIRWTVVLAGSRTRRHSNLEANITVDWSTWQLHQAKVVSSFKVLSIKVLLYKQEWVAESLPVASELQTNRHRPNSRDNSNKRPALETWSNGEHGSYSSPRPGQRWYRGRTTTTSDRHSLILGFLNVRTPRGTMVSA